MALNDTIQNIGDELIISLKPKVSGKIALSGYTDNLVGLTVNRSVYREFRILTEGIFTQDWQELTNENLSKFSEVVVYNFMIEVKYTRTGSDNTGSIQFVNFNLTGDFSSTDEYLPTVKKSIFKNSYNSEDLSIIENNLFKKLYKNGIVAKYVTRGDNNDKTEDSGFFVLFSSIAKFFAMILKFMFRFKDFNSDYELLYENVKQKGLFINENNIDLTSLKYLSEHYYDEIRRRGTKMVFLKKGTLLKDGTENEFDGELIRLFNVNPNDEIIQSNLNKKYTNWCLGNNSPLYRGFGGDINKMFGYRYDFLQAADVYKESSDHTEFGFYLRDNSSVEYDALELQTVYYEESEEGDDTGFHFYTGNNTLASVVFGRNQNENLSNKFIKVDCNLSYQISFSVKFLGHGTGNVNNNLISFGIEGFDKNGIKLNNAFTTIDRNLIKSDFFSNNVEDYILSQWYEMKFILHNTLCNSDISKNNELRFNTNFIKNILPKLKIQGNEFSFEIKDLTVKPITYGSGILNDSRNTPMCFIHSSNFSYIYVKNNNKNVTKEEIERISNKYLLPYNSNNFFTHL